MQYPSYEKSLSGNRAGAAIVQVYNAKQTQLDTILTQTDAMLLFKCVKSLSGLYHDVNVIIMYKLDKANIKWKKLYEYATPSRSLSYTLPSSSVGTASPEIIKMRKS